jgi:hypothetical protein
LTHDLQSRIRLPIATLDGEAVARGAVERGLVAVGLDASGEDAIVCFEERDGLDTALSSDANCMVEDDSDGVFEVDDMFDVGHCYG